MSLNRKISKGALRNTAIPNMLNNSEHVLLYTLKQKKKISVSNIYIYVLLLYVGLMEIIIMTAHTSNNNNNYRIVFRERRYHVMDSN